MSVSTIDICNLALGRVGCSQFISSINEASNEARCCKRFYAMTRDRVLSAAPWGFAACYVDLQDIGTPPAEWAYRYRYPLDCLRLRDVLPPESAETTTVSRPLEYAVIEDATFGALAICCDLSPVRALYTRRIENESLFSPQFCHAFAWALAAEIATPLTANVGHAATAASAYQSALTTAIADSLNEMREPQPPLSDFILARR